MFNNIVSDINKNDFENDNISIDNKDQCIISSIQKQIEKRNSNVFEISKINTSSMKTSTATTTIQLKKTENTVKDSVKVIFNNILYNLKLYMNFNN